MSKFAELEKAHDRLQDELCESISDLDIARRHLKTREEDVEHVKKKIGTLEQRMVNYDWSQEDPEEE